MAHPTSPISYAKPGGHSLSENTHLGGPRVFQFIAGRFLHDEAALSRWSCGQDYLSGKAQGRSIALVGNARSLSDKSYGEMIDDHDLVVRINKGPMPCTRSHGHKTDWLAISIPVCETDLRRHDPSATLWMTRKRKRLPYRIASRKGFYLNPIGQPQKLSVDLGSPPSTGAMVLQLLSALPVQRISVFGFDFFSSMSNSGSRTAAQVPHDFEAERKYAERIYMSDPKFTFF